MTKICARCCVEKLTTEFYRNHKCRGERTTVCKECTREHERRKRLKLRIERYAETLGVANMLKTWGRPSLG